MTILSEQDILSKSVNHVPRMLFVSQNNSTVIYAKSFDGGQADPALVACSFNAISIFVKNTFNRNNVRSWKIDDLNVENRCIDDVNITYFYQGNPSESRLDDLVERLQGTEIWDMLSDVSCQVPDTIQSQMDMLVSELIM